MIQLLAILCAFVSLASSSASAGKTLRDRAEEISYSTYRAKIPTSVIAVTVNNAPNRTPIKNSSPVRASSQKNNDWSGFYIGGQVGSKTSLVDVNNPELTFGGSLFEFALDPEVNFTRLASGAYAGYNFSFDDWILGAEASFVAGSFSGSALPVYNSSLSADNQDDLWGVDVGPIYQLSARVGRVWERTMLYGKLGVAITDIQADFLDTANANAGSRAIGDEEWHYGAVFGAGGEYKLFSRWTIGLDYSYINFSEEKHRMRLLSNSANHIDADFNPNVHLALFRLGYQFN